MADQGAPDHAVTFMEVIGQPGVGYVREGEPPLPSVVLTGDEALHLTAIMGGAAQGQSAHESGLVLDPDCPICAAAMAKMSELAAAAEEARRA